MEEEMKKNSEEFRRITMKVLVMQLFSTTIMDLVAYGGASVGIVLTLLGLRNQEVTFQIAMFMVLIGAEFFLPMRALGSAFHVAMNGATAGKKVITMLKEECMENGTEKMDTISEIQLENVSYHYPDAKENILQNINMVLKKGFTSLIGDSGCGKSTLSKILTRQLEGYEGKIRIDAKELSSLDIADYRKHVCYLSNDTFLLHLSIRDGFRFYHPELDEKTMLALLEEVSLKDRVMDAGGLDYVPQEGANDLSGGEKQRLVLSYYLSTKRDFYVFDETTSNIDKESEEIILDKIHALSKNCIVLFISHRLHNALKADYVYYFDKEQGKLLSGTVDELLKTCSPFMQNMENERRWEEIL